MGDEEALSAVGAGTEAEQDQALMLEIQAVLNRHSRENRSGTPDFVLAGVMFGALVNFELSARARDNYRAFMPKGVAFIPAAGGGS